jgi:PAS domain S-box-containing protein
MTGAKLAIQQLSEKCWMRPKRKVKVYCPKLEYSRTGFFWIPRISKKFYDMKLRIIILILSSFAFLSTLAGGYLYYSALKTAAIEGVQTQVRWHAETIKYQIDHQISTNQKAVRGLSGHDEMKRALTEANEVILDNANKILDNFNTAFEASAAYLIDLKGSTIASSNRNDSDDFVDKNFVFQPYFKQAIEGTPSVYAALGATSGKRGIYFSHPVYGYDPETPLGVVVIKASVEKMENELLRMRFHTHGMISLLSNPDGVIFMSDSERYLFQSLEAMPDGKASEIATFRQFGDRLPKRAEFEVAKDSIIIDKLGSEYIFARKEITSLPGWHIYHLNSINGIKENIYAPLAEKPGTTVFVLCIFIGLSVAVLYRLAHVNISLRKAAEKSLTESEERFRSMSVSAKDALVTINNEGFITFWNGSAAKIFGYSAQEALGQELHPLLAPKRYRELYRDSFREFKKTGTGNALGKTLELSAMRKNGSEFPIELSLSSYQNSGCWNAIGTIRDISDRKLAEQEKEKLIAELKKALKDVKQLSGLLPLCSHCKKVRDDKGYWNQIDAYISKHSEADISHSICPDCAKKYYPDFVSGDLKSC